MTDEFFIGLNTLLPAASRRANNNCFAVVVVASFAPSK
jgi:hypothetical protein